MNIIFNPMMATITIPVLAGIVCYLLPRRLDKERALVAVGGAAVTALLGLALFLGARSLAPGATHVFVPRSLLALRLDSLSGFVLFAVTIFGFLSALYSLKYMEGRKRLNEYYACLLWTIGLSCGAVLANHLILLLILWGMLGATLYLMVGMGGSDASAAAKKTFIIIGGSDCFLVLGVAIVWVMTRQMAMDQVKLAMNSNLSAVAFLCFTAAALAKAGAMPLHSWVPDCGEKAPLSVSAFLPASLDKLLGIYLLARTAHGMFESTTGTRVFLMLIGAGTVMCAVMMALVQHDLRRLLSYHAVSQVGYMVLGIGSGTAIGLAGGLFHMLNHAIYKSSLFMCAGSVHHRTGTSDLDKLGGLAGRMPITFGACFIAAMAISGIPPLNGFASKWMVYQGIIEGGRQSGPWAIWLVAAMFGSALTLASFVKVLHAVFLRKPPAESAARKVVEVSPAMWLPTAILGLLCVLFGVFWRQIPYRHVIEPVVGKNLPMLGAWWGGAATIALLAAVAAGVVVYLLTTARRPRACPTYIGGELLEEVDIPGEARGEARDVEVTGVDFYRTVENMVPFSHFYEAAGKKLFDVYDVGTRVLFYFVDALRSAHTGRLPLYLTWFLAGFLLLVWMLM